MQGDPNSNCSKLEVPKWLEGQMPFTFFQNVEDTMMANGENRSRWASLVVPYLQEKAFFAYQSDVPETITQRLGTEYLVPLETLQCQVVVI